MKHRILCIILVLSMIVVLLPCSETTAVAAEAVSDEIIANRINELCELLEGKYFNTNQSNACGKTWVKGHGCKQCSVTNVMRTQWFKDIFGTVSPSQLFLSSGQSCMGFVEFAAWYIYRADNSDSVRRDSTVSSYGVRYAFNYENISALTNIGDYLRLGDSHSVIFISCNSSGIEVLDCNWSGTYNCKVQRHTIPYSKYDTFIVSKLYSVTNGKNSTTTSVNSTLNITATSYPTGTLEPGSSFPLSGNVTSNYMITSFKGEIIDRAGNVASSASQTASTKNFAIRRSKVDMGLKFASLAEGEYRLKYTATDKSGKTSTWESDWFRVGNGTSKSTYTVTFNANGGTVYPASIEVAGGVSNWSLPTPTRTGYTFLGWFTEPRGSSMMVSSSNVLDISSNETLYAHWSANSYTITFDAKGGKVSPISKSVTYDSTYGTLPTPTRAGYTFGGWWYDDDDVGVCSNVTSSTTVKLTGNTTLYAVWTKNEVPDDGGNTVCTNHKKGTFLFAEEAHPHYNYYLCSNCGAKFTDGSTKHMDSCDDCWGAWSGWSTTKVTASDTRQVETRKVKVSDARTEYRYGRYIDSTGTHDCWCEKYFKSLSYIKGSVTLQYTGWSTTRYSDTGKDWSCGKCSGTHIGVDHTSSDGRSWWNEYVISGESYYWEESRTVDAVYRTEYRYRDAVN